MCLLTSNTSKIPGKLRAAWRTESGELFFNIQLPSASHRFPLPSVFFVHFLQFLRSLFQSPSGSFRPFPLPSGCFCLLELLRPLSTPFRFSASFYPSASLSFLQLPVAPPSFPSFPLAPGPRSRSRFRGPLHAQTIVTVDHVPSSFPLHEDSIK